MKSENAENEELLPLKGEIHVENHRVDVGVSCNSFQKGRGREEGKDSYDTFFKKKLSDSFDTNICGLSTFDARQILLKAVDAKIENIVMTNSRNENKSWCFNLSTPFWLYICCAIGRLLYFWWFNYNTSVYTGNTKIRMNLRNYSSLWEGIVLISLACLNEWLNYVQRKRLGQETADRIRMAISSILKHCDDDIYVNKCDNDSDFMYPDANNVRLSPSSSYIACYRDNTWQRIPMNLLVIGDYVALMSGDVTPGTVSQVHFDTVATSFILPRGSRVPLGCTKPDLHLSSNSENFEMYRVKETSRCTATFDTDLLLSLCGDMRIFEMHETPIEKDIDNVFKKMVKRPETLIQKQQRRFSTINKKVAFWFVGLYLICGCLIRFCVLYPWLSVSSTKVWGYVFFSLFTTPVTLLLCFFPMGIDFVSLLAEAAATSRVLSIFEIIQRKSISSHPNSSKRNFTNKLDGCKGRTYERSDNYAVDCFVDIPSSPSSPSRSTISPNKLGHEELHDLDVEEREDIRSKIKHYYTSARSWYYFLTTLKFRLMKCNYAHPTLNENEGSEVGVLFPILSIPLMSCRLLERLGSITMLCCFDDEVVCQDAPCVEEVFLLKDENTTNIASTCSKSSANTVVMDLHPDTSSKTGLRFEDVKWKRHLSSLKPIGLNILLNNALTSHHRVQYDELLNYLSGDSPDSVDRIQTEVFSDQYAALSSFSAELSKCSKRLAAHIRQLPSPQYLINLAREIGFCDSDLDGFHPRCAINVIAPQLAFVEHASDPHAQGQEDCRFRGNLKTHLHSTVFLDERSFGHQLMTRGHPSLAISKCSEYWDGKSICPLTATKRKAIQDIYNQWRVEDLDCIAFSYDDLLCLLIDPSIVYIAPVATSYNNSSFLKSKKKFNFQKKNSSGSGIESQMWRHSTTNSVDGRDCGTTSLIIPPIYLVESSDAAECEKDMEYLENATCEIKSDLDSDRDPTPFSQQAISDKAGSVVSSPGGLYDLKDCELGHSQVEKNGQNIHEDSRTVASSLPNDGATYSLFSVDNKGVAEDIQNQGVDEVSKNSSPSPQKSSHQAEEDMSLWKLQEDQIFLGMVASSFEPKVGTSQFIEDITAAGIRFVYFSPRNMRRSKSLVEKMGIETDWNVAISLRPLANENKPDPHRMTSNYSDWDVKARLPHGIEAIRTHLENIDNVPLLVSLFTDSTPETIEEMIGIFQENHEVVCGVGTSIREGNVPLFARSDIAIALEGENNTIMNDPLPKGGNLHVLTESDLSLSRVLNTLTCSVTLKDPTKPSPNLEPLLQLIRLGRKTLQNYRQHLIFFFVAHLFVGSFLLLGSLAPFPQQIFLSVSSLLYLELLIIPCITLSMLVTPSPKNNMTRTPLKNPPADEEEHINHDEIRRYVLYFVCRIIPPSIVLILCYQYIFCLSLSFSFQHNDSWIHYLFDTQTIMGGSQFSQSHSEVILAQDRAECVVLTLLIINLICSSCGHLYRVESIYVENPFRNISWVITCFCILLTQGFVIYLFSITIGDTYMFVFYSSQIHMYFWLFCSIWPICLILIDEGIKSHARPIDERNDKFLRMQFDTRLGMWSPR